MLDLRLLNAKLNGAIDQSMYRRNDGRVSGKASRTKGTPSMGDKNTPIEIFSFKQTPSKRAYQTLNQNSLWKTDPLNRKYNLEMTAEEKYGMQDQGFGISRRGNRMIKDDEEEKGVDD